MSEITNQMVERGEYRGVTFEGCAFLRGQYTLEGCTMTDCTINKSEVTFSGVCARSTSISNSITKFENCEFSHTDISRSEFGAENSKFTDITMTGCIADTAITGVQFRIGTIQLSAMGPREVVMVNCDLANVQLSSDIPMKDCNRYRCVDIHATRIGGRRYELSVDADGFIRSGCRSFGRCSEAIDHWGNEKYKNPQRGRLYVALVEWLEREEIARL